MAPIVNWIDNWKSKKYIEAAHDTIIAADVAKPFNILSAYFTTTATRRPPNDCRHTTNQTTPSYPIKNPFSWILLPSFMSIVTAPITIPKNPSSTFLNHTDCLVPFRIFSKYTPANPDMKLEITTAIKPLIGLCSTIGEALLGLSGCNWTIATPTNRITKDIHCNLLSCFFSMITEKMAVVNILN
uniref:Uncharacterized protein n=1 Tax=Arion vulgaris TaxID=1028688 RepID=A0A0B6ZIY5_9EUPU